MRDISPTKQRVLDSISIMKSHAVLLIVFCMVSVLSAYVFCKIKTPLYQSTAKIVIGPRKRTMKIAHYKQYSKTYIEHFYFSQYILMHSSKIFFATIDKLNLQDRLSPYKGIRLPQEIALNLLRHCIAINYFEETNVIEITATHKDRLLSAEIVNAFIEEYERHTFNTARRDMVETLKEMALKLDETKKRLQESENRLNKIKKQKDITFYKGTNINETNLESFNKQYLDAKIERIIKEVRINKINELSESARADLLALDAQYESLVTLKQSLVAEEIRLSMLIQSYGLNHPDIKEPKSRIDDLRKKVSDEVTGILAGLNIQYEVVKKREDSLSEILDQFKKEILSLGSGELEYLQAERDVATDQEVYISIKGDYIKYSSLVDMPKNSVEVITRAIPPLEGEKFRPRTLLSVLSAGMCSGGMGVLLILAYGFMMRSVYSENRDQAFSVLTIIPNSVRKLVQGSEYSTEYEAFRILATKMLTEKRKNNTTTYLVTSGGAGEGKTLTSANLACVLGELNQRVLLVDFNVRKPDLFRYLEIMEPALGFSDLDRIKDYKKLITPVVLPNVDLLSVGKDFDFAKIDSFITLKRLQKLLRDSSADYDMVIFDGPPVVGFGDCVLLAGLVDKTIMVVSHKLYSATDAESAINEIIKSSGARLMGSILNNVHPEEDVYKIYYQVQYH